MFTNNVYKLLILTVFICFNSYSQKKGWLTGFPEVFERSIKEEKPIMANFTGSDWCGWCKRLVKEVFDQKEFKDWAKDKIIPVELDFPRRTKLDENLITQNRQLQRLFAVQGYPTIWLVRPKYQEENKVNFEKLGKTGYVRGGVSNWIQSAEQYLN